MKKTEKIIFDTDLGCDCDDVVALCLLAAAHKRGEAELIGVTMSLPYDAAADCTLAILGEYGLSDIPVFPMGDTPEWYRSHDIYATAVKEKFGEYINPRSRIEENPVHALRRMLVQSEEKVTLVAIGPLFNIGRLLDSEADDSSTLDGVSLVRDKVEMIAIMGAYFEMESHEKATTPEWNILSDVNAARTVAEKSPVKVVFLPFEAGLDMISGAKNVAKYGESRPSSYSLIRHGSSDGRHSWDPATALYAVYGKCGCFIESKPGRVVFDEAGVSTFVEDENGLHRVLTLAKTKAEIADEIDRLSENDR